MDLYIKHSPRKGQLEESAYYYWYLYMQLIEGYGRKHRLWKDFGDVQIPFRDWWLSHEEKLFRTAERYGILELKTAKDIHEARLDRAFMVRVDPDCTREYLIHYFKEFLNEKNIRIGAGRRKHQDEVKHAKYPFYQRPDVKSLRISYEAWTLRHQVPKLTLYEIGIKLNLSPNNVINEKKDTQAIKTAKRNCMNAMVSRYLRRAETIMHFIEAGLFPVSKYDWKRHNSWDENDDSQREMVAGR
jgi:hypothetical protein